ncbi:MAG TPA: TAT-variant-translocated molybdopterin oxidoreductase [Verrucomicrobiae bacterium]|jgi:molybdopterin-containing oxidoreductase family iron-sulfur binding subunit
MIDDLRLPKSLGTENSRPRPAIHNSQSFWRSLMERADPKKFRESARDEFPAGTTKWNQLDRRSFLKFMGASLALAGLPACTRQPLGKIIPYVNQPEELVPGRPLYFATAMSLGGFATGLLVESHEGHPTKIEGNPGHPASLGATNVFHQASLLDLYDPARSQAVLNNGSPDTWENFVAAMNQCLLTQQAGKSRGVRLLTETISSPTLAAQIYDLLEKFPGARWHQFEPANHDNVYEGARLAFGRIVETQYHFEKAAVILSLDSDFLYRHPNSVRYVRDFASHRRARFDSAPMNRMYVVESSPSVTGSNADHHLPLTSKQVGDFALALAGGLGAISVPAVQNQSEEFRKWISVVSADLLKNRGTCLIIVGENQPPAVHALGHLLNHFLGNFGNTITFTDSAIAQPTNQVASLRDLVDALDAGSVDTLVILGGNPVFTAPADFRFAASLARAKTSVHLSPEVNETSALCHWHLPQNHYLESWGDVRAFDGTVSIVQPLILPLYAGKSPYELLDAMVSPPGRTDYDIVRDFWKLSNQSDSETGWHRALHDGFITDTAMTPIKISLQSFPIPQPAHVPDGLEITFQADPAILDGRFANNGWLQELPKPITKLTWDNPALISPALAQREQLSNGDSVELELQNRKITVPVWITPGQADDSIALSFGYGRTEVGPLGTATGFNVYPLRSSDALWSGDGVKLRKTGASYPLATTQIQHVIDSDERQIFREGTIEEFHTDPDFVQKNTESPDASDTLYAPKEFKYDGYRWGMSIDLSACIGCNACVIACQSENNIPVVGKQQVMAGRVMQWIRVDSYFKGNPENPQTIHQPVPCMQCEDAPCEAVCPVDATVHDKEGLNLQVYNRCIGTRYCSNNCPYKVRRFNFFQYADYKTPVLKLMRNPDVTVRWRGVMEKCTYCIQRISLARITSEEQSRKIGDGEIQTACQQVCPANAIVFGDLSDPDSRVSKLKTHKLNFSMLGQLNTRPRTTYLAKIRNPNPDLT